MTRPEHDGRALFDLLAVSQHRDRSGAHQCPYAQGRADHLTRLSGRVDVVPCYEEDCQVWPWSDPIEYLPDYLADSYTRVGMF